MDNFADAPVGSVCAIIDCEHKTAPYIEFSKNLVVRTNNIRHGRLVLDDIKYTTDAGFLEWTKRAVPEEGDVLFTREAPAGETCLIPNGLQICMGQRMVLLQPDKAKINSAYLAMYLLSGRCRYEIYRYSIGSTVQRINIADIRRIRISTPSLVEQEKIAATISTWDQAIEATEKLIENSKAQKKALMQQLLTGQRRYSQFIDSNEKTETNYGDLPMDWLILPIGDIAFEQNERAGKNSVLPVLSCSKHDGFVDSLEYFKKKVYSDDTSNYKVVRRGCYGFPSNHIEEGSIGYQDIRDSGIVSPIYSVFETSEQVHDGYLFRLLKTEHYRQIFQARTNASVDRRGSLRWKEFCKIRVPLPSFAEQQKISETIDTADNELANLTDQLVQLQAQKRALMQQLLTGKHRVNVTEKVL